MTSATSLWTLTGPMASFGRMLGPIIGFADLLTVDRDENTSLPVRLASEPKMRELGDFVIAAADHGDLLERIDERVFEFDTVARAPRTAGASRPVGEGIGDLDMVSLRRVLGDAAATECQRGHDALKRIVGLNAAEAFSEAVGGGSAPEAPVTQMFSLRQIIYNVPVPAPLKKVALAYLRTLVAMTAIARAEEVGRRLEPWLAMALARTFSDGLVTAANGVEWVLDNAPHLDVVRDALAPDLDRLDRYRSFVDGLYKEAAQADKS